MKHRFVLRLFAALAVIMTGFAGASFVTAQDAAIGTPVAVECTTDIGTTEIPEGMTGYVVDGEQSSANYTVKETLNSGDAEPVGTTNAVAGTIVLDDNGVPQQCSRFDVDLRTLATDNNRRDARVQDALETSEYPVATFIVTSVRGADEGLQDGQETEITLVGNMTIHGVEKQVTWTGKVTLEGDTLSGTATTTFTFDDFSVEKPVVGPVLSIEDDITLTMDIVATAQS